MAQWNRNTVPKCENKKCSDEVLVTVEAHRVWWKALQKSY